MYWDYERYNTETGDVEMCPINDDNGEVTGHLFILLIHINHSVLQARISIYC